MRPTQNPDPFALLAYLTGDRSSEIVQSVRQWVVEDPDAGKELAALETAQKNLSSDLTAPTPTQRREAWQALVHRLELETPSPAIQPSKAKPRFTQPIRFVVTGFASLLVIAVLVFGVQSVRTNTASLSEKQTTVVATATGQRAAIVLPDGTRLTMAPQTTVRYAPDFGHDERDIQLEGEAHFEAAHVVSRPLIVTTATSRTQVLGTSFTVRAYRSDTVVQVAVFDGKVALRPKSSAVGTGTTLVQGELGALTAAGLATVIRETDLSRYSAWLENRLTFHATPLRDVLEELERWYDVELQISDPTLASSPLEGTLPTTSLDEAVERISAVLNLRFTRQGRTITFSPLRGLR